MSVAKSTHADLPGYGTLTFTLIPVGYTSPRSVQVSGFGDNGRLTPLQRLVSASCSSGQRFAFGFLQIRSRPRHPCRSANSSPCRVSRGLSPPSKCALPGAPYKKFAGRIEKRIADLLCVDWHRYRGHHRQHRQDECDNPIRVSGQFHPMPVEKSGRRRGGWVVPQDRD